VPRVFNNTLQRAFAQTHRLVYSLTNGRVTGKVGDAPVLMLTSLGRKSGQPRTTPLFYIQDGGSYVVAASNAGRDFHPAWYLNLQDDPAASVTVDNRSIPVRASTATPEEKGRLWPRFDQMFKGYEGYRARTDRDIPLVILRPFDTVAT
jgi:deazaflavin-dependent oxidoreductase (nitroreductase family)